MSSSVAGSSHAPPVSHYRNYDIGRRKCSNVGTKGPGMAKPRRLISHRHVYSFQGEAIFSASGSGFAGVCSKAPAGPSRVHTALEAGR